MPTQLPINGKHALCAAAYSSSFDGFIDLVVERTAVNPDMVDLLAEMNIVSAVMIELRHEVLHSTDVREIQNDGT